MKIFSITNNGAFKIGKFFPEFMSALFLFLFLLLRPIVLLSTSSSLILLLSSVACLLVLYCYILIHNRHINIGAGFLICSITLALLFFDLLFRGNENTNTSINNFFIYGLLPMLFLVTVRDYKPLLWFFSHFAILTGLMYMVDPILNDYKWSGGYMQYGYGVMMAAVFGCMLMFFFYKSRGYVLLLLLFTGCIFIFANKGAFLVELVGLSFYYLVVNKNNHITITSVAIVSIVLLLLILNANWLISMGMYVATALGIEGSYSLNTFAILFSNESSYITNQRTELWDLAAKMLSEKPLFGWGVGWFEKFSDQPYPHNFMYEILVEYGWVGGILFLLALFKAIKLLINEKNYERRIFLITLFLLWTGPLMFSMTYWRMSFFWSFWVLLFSKSNKRSHYKSLN